MDELAQVASIEPGIWGPELENYLNARGWTLGHFPQSFEFSTLGGWIATRSAGFASTKYGTIETMTLGLRMATPAGMIETQSAQENSVGPSLLQLLIGSEGALGVITRATMRIRALSKIANYRAMLFGTFADGVAAVRDIVQSDLAPATIQLLDEEDTRCFFAFRKQARGLQGLVETTESRMLSTLGKSIEQGALLILGFEGDAYTVKVTENHVLAICQDHGAFDLGARIAHAWFRDRFESPYLRDALMDHGVMMDTFETATTWGNLELGYQKLTHALSQAAQEVGARILVLTHLSQCRREGATLGVTFLAPITPHQEINHWEHIQRAAIECSIDHGGAIAPHSGVGYEYAFWLQQKLGALGYDTLLSLKKRLDPKNIMNPGKLFLPA
jgi:alkyldihydroxyacetonephosphate synthase